MWTIPSKSKTFMTKMTKNVMNINESYCPYYSLNYCVFVGHKVVTEVLSCARVSQQTVWRKTHGV